LQWYPREVFYDATVSDVSWNGSGCMRILTLTSLNLRLPTLPVCGIQDLIRLKVKFHKLVAEITLNNLDPGVIVLGNSAPAHPKRTATKFLSSIKMSRWSKK